MKRPFLKKKNWLKQNINITDFLKGLFIEWKNIAHQFKIIRLHLMEKHYTLFYNQEKTLLLCLICPYQDERIFRKKYMHEPFVRLFISIEEINQMVNKC